MSNTTLPVKVKITNQKLQMAVQALQQFNPADISYSAKMRNFRNLASLSKSYSDYMYLHGKLANSFIIDKNKAPSQDGIHRLTPAEDEKFKPESQKLLLEEAEVQIQPLWLYDSSEGRPIAEQRAWSIDISSKGIGLQNYIGGALIDWYFLEATLETANDRLLA